jgi:protoheme IX farnesyltransferase
MVATSVALWPVAGMGWFYTGMALTLGIVFLVEAYDLKARSRETEELSVIKPMRLFHLSNAYLALLFVAAAADPFLR